MNLIGLNSEEFEKLVPGFFLFYLSLTTPYRYRMRDVLQCVGFLIIEDAFFHTFEISGEKTAIDRLRSLFPILKQEIISLRSNEEEFNLNFHVKTGYWGTLDIVSALKFLNVRVMLTSDLDLKVTSTLGGLEIAKKAFSELDV